MFCYHSGTGNIKRKLIVVESSNLMTGTLLNVMYVELVFSFSRLIQLIIILYFSCGEDITDGFSQP